MNSDQILRDVLAERADDRRPHAASMLDEIHRRAGRRRGRMALAVGGSVAAVAAVAVTAVSVSGTTHSSGPGPHDVAGGTSGATTSHVVTASSVAAQQARRRAIAAAQSRARAMARAAEASARATANASGEYSTIAASWLPGPGYEVEADSQPGFEERDYDVTVDGTDMDVIIYTESGGLPGRTEAGSNYESTTVNGHPARVFVDSNATIVAFDLGNGTVAYAGPSVDEPTASVTTERITAIALLVARDMQFDRHDPIPAGCRPHSLKPGQKLDQIGKTPCG